MQRKGIVGRTPSSAPDPLVRLFPCQTRPTRGSAAGQGARPSVPSMGRISLDERSQPEPMTATVANRKA